MRMAVIILNIHVHCVRGRMEERGRREGGGREGEREGRREGGGRREEGGKEGGRREEGGGRREGRREGGGRREEGGREGRQKGGSRKERRDAALAFKELFSMLAFCTTLT